MKFDFIPSKALIDQRAIYDNFKLVQNLHPKKKIFVAVKADAYGHGVREVCAPVIKAGAAGFCVAYVDEAREIRGFGFNNLILVLGASEAKSAAIAQKEDISLTAPSLAWLQEVVKYLDSTNPNKLKVHLAIDSGMGRIGMTRIEELEQAFQFVQDNSDKIELEGMFTHFATADADDEYYHEQQKRFKLLAKGFKQKVKYLHCENSASSLLEEDDDFTNSLRLGVALYGISPFIKPQKLEQKFKPVLSLESQISFIKKVSKGTKISYGATYTAPQDEYIATVSIGYADGWLRRMQGFNLLVEGEFCPIVGRVTMDQLMIKVSKCYSIGTKVTLIGNSGSKKISAEEAADFAKTIPYEILTTISRRVPRIAVNKIEE